MPDSLTIQYTERPVFPAPAWSKAWNHTCLSEILNQLEIQYPTVRVTGLGESYCGKTIYGITLGNPDAPGVLYVGGIDGCDSHSPAALLRFIGDYADFLHRGKRMYGVSMSCLHTSRCITVIPLLNPDGCENARKTGTSAVPPLGNGRGADLSEDFESACRETETCAVTGFVRTMGNIRLCFSLHPSETGISYQPQIRRAVPLGRLISRMIGCPVSKSPRGIAEWFSRETGYPAFTAGTLGDDNSDYIGLYASLREALFSMPLLL